MRVGIIGGGPGGLFTAYMLQRKCGASCAVTMFEASARVGGMLDTRCFGRSGQRYEAGIAEVYVYPGMRDDPLPGVLHDLNIRTVPMSGHSVVFEGRVVRCQTDLRTVLGEKAGSAVRDHLASAAEHLPVERWRATSGRIAGSNSTLRRTYSAMLREVRDAAARRFLRAVTHADLAAEPHNVDAATAIDNAVMNLPGYVDFHLVPDGMSSIAERLLERTDARIERLAQVVRVDTRPDGRYRTHFLREGREHVAEFDAIVAALPMLSLSAIDWRGEVLEPAMAAHIARFDVPGHYLRVTLLFDRPHCGDRIREHVVTCDSFGGSAVYDESLRFGNCAAVLGVLIAGNHALALSNDDDGAIVRHVLGALPEQVLPDPDAKLVEARVHRRAGLVCARPGRDCTDAISDYQPAPQLPRFLVVGNYQLDATLNGVCTSASLVTEMLSGEMRHRSTHRRRGIVHPRSQSLGRRVVRAAT